MSIITSNTDDLKIQRLKNIQDEVKELHPILHRLLSKLPGVTRVENTHGVMEHGADFVLSKTDLTVDLPSYCGVIAKCGNINKNEAHRVIEQVRECNGERLFLSGKQKISLSEIWVVTNGVVAPHAKQLIHEQFAASKIQFIDRDHLIKLIDRNLKTFWTDLDVHLGDYLAEQVKQIDAEDRELSLAPQTEPYFYIPQDITRFRGSDPIARKHRRLVKPESVQILQEVKKNRLLLVEGDAGVGKSKCARETARACCDPRNFHDANLIPVRINCVELFSVYRGDLQEAIRAKLSGYEQLLDQEATEFLVIADGLDELKQLPKEANLQVNQIADQLTDSSKTRVILFARPFLRESKEEVPTPTAVRLEINPLSLTRTIEF